MQERRRNPRFEIMRPARLKISPANPGDTHAEVEGLVHDAAKHGVLVVTRRGIVVGTEIEVTVFLPNDIQTSCAGKVVRVVANLTADGQFGLGVACTRPFSDPVRLRRAST
jgi:PilZ domain